MRVTESVRSRLLNDPDRNACCIDNRFYSYGEVAAIASGVRKTILGAGIAPGSAVGFLANVDVHAYGTMLGILFAGCAYVPLSPGSPRARNESVVGQANLAAVFTNEPESIGQLIDSDAVDVHDSRFFADAPIDLGSLSDDPKRLAYILFTSGSTGAPKGVPITHGNLDAFMESFLRVGQAIEEDDRVLQMFELTFDFSVFSVFAPLCSGACLYPVSSKGIRAANTFVLLEDQSITVAPMVPSVISYLRPYFADINLPNLRLSVFCGEALYEDVLTEWAECVPNARIQNYYGPTEATIFCTVFDWATSKQQQKSHNGVVSIGQPFPGSEAILLDSTGSECGVGVTGELCIAGPQLSPGYWNDPERTKKAFIEIERQGKTMRFYRTGDAAFRDEDGDLFFVGRIDNQEKIQGFRVELGEIEFHAREFLTQPLAVVAVKKARGTELHLVVEKFDGEPKAVLAELKSKLPGYMIPVEVHSVNELPLSANGKIDRNALKRDLGDAT